MGYRNKTKAQLIEQLEQLNRQVEVLKQAQIADHDLTGQTGAAEALQQDPTLLSKILSTPATFIVVIGREGRTRLMNRSMLESLGYTSQEVEGLDYLSSFIPRRDRQHMSRLFADLLARPGQSFGENRVLAKDGRELLVEWCGRSTAKPNGEVHSFIGVGIDITRRRRVEKELRQSEALAVKTLGQSEERYRLLVENIPAVSWTTSQAGKTSYISPNVTEVYGYTPDEIYTGGEEIWMGRIHPEDREQILEAFAALFSRGEAFAVEYRIQCKDDHWIWVNDRASLVSGEDDELCAYGVFHDITDRKKAEKELNAAHTRIQELKAKLEAENVSLREELSSTLGPGNIVAESKNMRAMLAQVSQVAQTDSTVLVLGETGTGKEILARLIHDTSNRKERRLVVVNCAAMPGTLVESELFGREKGAYTGALTRQVGRFEVADGSSIFLDEVGELPFEIQAKLLRILEEKTFERLGSSQTREVDVRVIAATNRDISREVSEGRFREDLFYRLNVFPISIPPLRDRPGDIPLLAWTFVNELSEKMGKRIEGINRGSMQDLQRYHWPGNVRELRNTIERAMILARGPNLKVVLPKTASIFEDAPGLKLADMERQHIIAILERSGWRVRGLGGAAELLDLKPSTLESRMTKLGIRRPGKGR